MVSDMKNYSSFNTKFFLLASLVAACGGKSVPFTEGDASPDVSIDAGGCLTNNDCLASMGPCQQCNDSSVACPSATCVNSKCIVEIGGCQNECPFNPPINAACNGASHCEYGMEVCCGKQYPSTVCDCMNNQFSCYATDSCMLPSEPCLDSGTSECLEDSNCAVSALCMMCSNGSCASAAAKCVDGKCEVNYSPCP